MKKGFTLPEILVTVMIVSILVTMAVPMYEKAVEKSRLAEVSVTLKRMGESKLRAMDDRNIGEYSSSTPISKDQLDSPVTDTDDFNYYMLPGSFPNAVCAVRRRGDNAGTSFLYLGEVATQYCIEQALNNAVCTEYRSNGEKLFCQNATGTTSCDGYGMDSINFGLCPALGIGCY